MRSHLSIIVVSGAIVVIVIVCTRIRKTGQCRQTCSLFVHAAALHALYQIEQIFAYLEEPKISKETECACTLMVSDARIRTDSRHGKLESYDTKFQLFGTSPLQDRKPHSGSSAGESTADSWSH